MHNQDYVDQKNHNNVLATIKLFKDDCIKLFIMFDSRRIAVTLVYFGLTINATDIAGDKYMNFALASLVEIPACLLNWLLMESLSRKMALSSTFVLSGVFCFMYNLTPTSECFYNYLSYEYINHNR